MTISLIITENPVGSGRAFNYNKQTSKSKTIVKSDILNDNLCLLRAFLIGKCHADKNPYLKKLKKPSSVLLKKSAMELSIKLNFKNEACGLIEIKKLDDSFPDYQLMVLNDLSETIYLNFS